MTHYAAAQPTRSLVSIADMPLSFLGFALWRAWVSLSYANPVCPMPVNTAAGHLSYDIVLAACAITVALLSSRLAPLAGKRWVYPAIALLLGFSAAANTAAVIWPATKTPLVVPATLAGGAGSALLILLWCEIYSCLGAARVALYYALTIIGGVLLFVWVWRFSSRLPLSTLYRAPAVLICCGLLIVPLFGIGGSVAGSFCTALGVMLFNALVLLFLCDIAKRFGVSALLLFGIEETLLLVSWAGRGAAEALDRQGLFGTLGPAVGSVAAVAVIAIVTLLVLNKREIDERWGLAFLGKRATEEDERSRLAHRCAEVATRGRLTPREGEVLELLAEGKSLSGVAGELIIAEGTAKAHTRHIYEKLGINTRQELLDLLMAEA